MKSLKHIWLFFAAAIALPFMVYGAVKWYEYRFTRLPVLSQKDMKIESFTMLNQDGETITPDDWNDRIVVVDFFFVNCPVICPNMTRSLKRVQQSQANGPEVLITSFSVDPVRDSVPRLKAYSRQMDIQGNWHLLTGDKTAIYRLARNSFRVVATEGDGGSDDFIHSELLVLMDREKRIRGYYNGTLQDEVDALIRDLERLKREYK